MPFSITCSTKILTLAIAPFNIIFRFCPLIKKKCTLLPEGTYVHIQQHIHQKDLTGCLPLHYCAKVVIVELKKKHRRGIQLCYAYGAFNQTK